MNNNKFGIKDIIYISVIVAVIAGAAGFGYWLYNTTTENFNLKIENYISEYTSAKEAYEKAYTDVVARQEEWAKAVETLTAELNQKSQALNESNETLNEIYRERDEKNKAEEARLAALSEEELAQETKISEYNEMVSALRESNEEYAGIYKKLLGYVGKTYDELSDSEKKEYIELIGKKQEFEKKYQEKEDVEDDAD